MVCQEPTSTPTGMSRPRPFAESSAATAVLSKASAPSPYTVSVGITTSRPPLSAPTADAIPSKRRSGSAQSNVSATASLPRKQGVSPPAARHESCPAGQILPRADVVEKSCALDQFDGARRRGVIVLDSEKTAWAQPAPSEAHHGLYHRHTVRPTEHRVRRIMLSYFRFQNDTIGNVRRVRYDQVNPPVQLGQQAWRSDVGADEFD